MRKRVCTGIIIAAVCLSGCGNITVKRSPDRDNPRQTEIAEGTQEDESLEETQKGIPVSEITERNDSEETTAWKDSEELVMQHEKASGNTIEDILAMDPAEWKNVEIVNGNIPEFDTENIRTGEWKEYAPADEAGRNTCMTAVVHTLYPKALSPCPKDLRPSGYHKVFYRIIKTKKGKQGTFLMRKCHLLKPVLGGSCEDPGNFFTGTYSLNFRPGMAKYEYKIIDYLKETDGYVLYRVRPRFIRDNALASGVEMEGYSLDDDGKSVCFHVFVRNIQDGISINYQTGVSYMLR